MDMEKKLQIFRSIIEINEDTSTPEEFISSMKKDILTNPDEKTKRLIRCIENNKKIIY